MPENLHCASGELVAQEQATARLVWKCWTGALAKLGVARANALEAKTEQGAHAARVRAVAGPPKTSGSNPPRGTL